MVPISPIASLVLMHASVNFVATDKQQVSIHPQYLTDVN
uniref:Uncharacterized protein n=1 Tax=Arundo donax TaxID=35708 RepID=A0A0A9ENR7_ARUDO